MPTPEGFITSTETWTTPAEVVEETVEETVEEETTQDSD